MKRIIIFLFFILVLSGCSITNKANIKQLELQKENDSEQNSLISAYGDFQYASIGELTPIYNENDILIGYLLKAITNECGSDCSSDLLFINYKDNKLGIEKIENFDGSSLGFDIIEENKYTYISSFIWGENEGHFGCHRFKINKIKFINNKIKILEEQVTNNKYAFDSGDAQGKCILFPGLENVLTTEQLFK